MSGGGANSLQTRVQVGRLLRLTTEDALFHDGDIGYARFVVDDHQEVAELRSGGYRARLGRAYYERHGAKPSSQAIQHLLDELEGKALYDGPDKPVATRVAEHEGAIYLDLCDERWQAVEVTQQGWRVVDNPPVNFRRVTTMKPLPKPRQGDLEPLWGLVNLRPEDRPLFAAWLLATLRLTGPSPLMVLHGEQGSAKSTTARMAKQLVDPGAAALRTPPASARDLMIAATNCRVLAFDNLSTVPPWLSDALCRLATGGGFATRTLYTDREEHVFEAQRPVLLNGIGQVAARSDLVDRAIVLASPYIHVDQRRTESELWTRFAEAHPYILGALLDGVARGLAKVDAVELAEMPRMADFAEWAVASVPAVGMSSSQFVDAYAANRGSASGAMLENSPIAAPLMALAEDGVEASASELLKLLASRASDTDRDSQGWPRSAAVLGKQLTRITPNLRHAGYEVIHRVGGDRRTWLLRKAPEPAVRAVQPSDTGLASEEPADGGRDRIEHSDGGRDGMDGNSDDIHTTRLPLAAAVLDGKDSKDGSSGPAPGLTAGTDPEPAALWVEEWEPATPEQEAEAERAVAKHPDLAADPSPDQPMPDADPEAET